MLTVSDFQTILALLTSPRLTINGAEALPLAQLQQKIKLTIDAASTPQANTEETDGNGTDTAE